MYRYQRLLGPHLTHRQTGKVHKKFSISMFPHAERLVVISLENLGFGSVSPFVTTQLRPFCYSAKIERTFSLIRTMRPLQKKLPLCGVIENVSTNKT